MELKKEQLDQVLLFIKECDGDELRLEIGDMKLILKKGADIKIFKEIPVEKDALEGEPAMDTEDIFHVTSPSAGIFYRRPEPGADPYVEMGSHVDPGDTLALIEVMKTFGLVQTEVRGHVVDILVEDGEMVEYGQTLFLIKRGGVAEG